jgi:hypothetical protein
MRNSESREDRENRELNDDALALLSGGCDPILSGCTTGNKGSSQAQPACNAWNACLHVFGYGPQAPQAVRQTFCNNTSRSRVERRPRSNACVSKKTCADLQVSWMRPRVPPTPPM